MTALGAAHEPSPGLARSAPAARALALAAVLALAWPGARGARAQTEPLPGTTISGAITGMQLLETDLDRGGQTRWGSVSIAGTAERRFTPGFSAALSAGFDDQDWRVRSAPAFAGIAPWAHLQRGGLTLATSVTVARTLVVGLSPTAVWAWETGAKPAKAFTYGGIVGAAAVISPRMTLGAGSSFTREFYAVRVQPFPIVDWAIADRVRIANAQAEGPLGETGVELRLEPGADWEVAAGGAYRSDRWRLRTDGPYADDVGEVTGALLLGRISRQLDRKSVLDLYLGSTVAGRLRIRDGGGNVLTSEREHASVSMAFTLRRIL